MEDIKKNPDQQTDIKESEELEKEGTSKGLSPRDDKDINNNIEKDIRENSVEEHPSDVKRVKIVAIKRRSDWAPLHYDAGDVEVSDGEWVVFPTDHGIEVGRIAGKAVPLLFPADIEVPKIERLASTQEIEQYYRNLEKEKNAWKVCEEFIKELGLSMKLVVVESFFDGSKIIFYYVAEQRVDFRELVKKLVRALRTRIEMRQIGVRHEAKMLGGIGCCGRELCCSTFLKSFDPISIKMAKAQNLPLNPSKISGICGRLLCCLTYEYDTYLDLKQGLPSLGKSCDTPAGEGKVINQNIILGTVTVALADGARREFSLKELEDYLASKSESKVSENNIAQSSKVEEDEEAQEAKDDIESNKDLLDRLSRHEDFSNNISYIELDYEEADNLHIIEDIQEDEEYSIETCELELENVSDDIRDDSSAFNEQEKGNIENEVDEEEQFRDVNESDEFLTNEISIKKESLSKTRAHGNGKRKRLRTKYKEGQDRRGGTSRSSRHERHIDKKSRKGKRIRSSKKERTKRR